MSPEKIKELKESLMKKEIERLKLEVEVLELYSEMLFKKKLSELKEKQKIKVYESLIIQSLSGVEK